MKARLYLSPAVGAAGQRVVEGVEEEGVVTVGAGHATHPRHVGQRRRHRGRGRQVDDPLAVRPGEKNGQARATQAQNTQV